MCRRCDAGGGGEALTYARAESRLGRGHPKTERLPYLGGLNGAEGIPPRGDIRTGDSDLLGSAEPCFNPGDGGGEAEEAAERPARRSLPGGGAVSGASSAWPMRANNPASRANQPAASKLGANGMAPASGTRPWVTRMP